MSVSVVIVDVIAVAVVVVCFHVCVWCLFLVVFAGARIICVVV